MPGKSYVVTGAGQGIGRVIAERLSQVGLVVAIDTNEDALDWTRSAAMERRVMAHVGDASDDGTLAAAAAYANDGHLLSGWVNNAAIFRDLDLHVSASVDTARLILANLAPAIAGCRCATRSFLAAKTPGAIVNISSHQAQRPVPGALAYATAKAAVEGLTRAVAVDYGRVGIRCNALALGSIETARSRDHIDDLSDDARQVLTSTLERLQPLAAFGKPASVADAVEFLLSDASRFLTGAVTPLDGGRAARGDDPEARNVID